MATLKECHSSLERNGASSRSCWSRGRFHQRPTKNGTAKRAASTCPSAPGNRRQRHGRNRRQPCGRNRRRPCGRKRLRRRNDEMRRRLIRQGSGRNVSCTSPGEGPPGGGHG